MTDSKKVILLSIFMLGITTTGCFKSRKKKGKTRVRTGFAARTGTKAPTMAFDKMIQRKFTDKERRLADPQGLAFRPLKKIWERGLRFDASRAAYDKKRGILYTTSRDHRRILAINLSQGRIIKQSGPVLKRIPRRDPRKMQRAQYSQSMEATITLTPDQLIVAQNVMKEKKLEIRVIGLSRHSFRRLWAKTLENPWETGWLSWFYSGVYFLGDSGDGPVHAFDPARGRLTTFNYPQQDFEKKGKESWNFAGTDGTRVFFYHAIKKPPLLELVAHNIEDGKQAWTRSVTNCIPKPMYLQYPVKRIFPCKVKTEEYKFIDGLRKFEPRGGRMVWQRGVHSRKRGQVTDLVADLVQLRASKDGKHVYFRSRWTLTKVATDSGNQLWSFNMRNREIGIVLEGRWWSSGAVMGGDYPYHEVIGLDAATGKQKWIYTETKGLPARGVIHEGVLAMFGIKELRVLSIENGKLLYKLTSKLKLERPAIKGGVLFVHTMGVRRGIRLSDQKLILHEKSEDETVVNNWVNLAKEKALILFDDTHHFLARLEPLTKSRSIKIPDSKIFQASLHTPSDVIIDKPRFSNDGKAIVMESPYDDRLWKIVLPQGTAQAVGKKRVEARGKEALALLEDSKSLRYRYKLTVKQKGGEAKEICKGPAGIFNWSRSGRYLIFAEKRRIPRKKKKRGKSRRRRRIYGKPSLMNFVVRAYDVKKDKTRDLLFLKKADREARLSNISFAPRDRRVTLVVEGLYGNHLVLTIPMGGGTIKGEQKIDFSDGTSKLTLPWHRTLQPTKHLGFRFEDTFGTVDWSKMGYLAILTKQHLSVRNRNGRSMLGRRESSVSEFAWSPDGRTLAYNREGNLWLLDAPSGRRLALSYFLPKREPRNDEEVKLGNPYRFRGIAWAPEGRRLAVGLQYPGEKFRRLATIDLSRCLDKRGRLKRIR